MVTITIPRKITNGKELIVVPKKEWENLWKIAKRKIYQAELEKGLKEALGEVKEGKVIGPFTTAKEAIAALKRCREK